MNSVHDDELGVARPSPHMVVLLFNNRIHFCLKRAYAHSRSGCLNPFSLAHTEFVNKAPLVVHDTPRLPFHESTAHSRGGWLDPESSSGRRALKPFAI